MGSNPDGETSEVQKKRLASEKFWLGIPGQHCPSSKKAKDSGSGGTCKDRCKEKGKVVFDEINSEQVSNSSRILGPLFDFDKNRASMTFQEGDILAIWDEYGMPRRYARVEKNDEIRYLRRKDDQHDPSVPYRAVGEFLIGSNLEFLDPLFISHKLLGWEMDDTSSYRVFPQKGEIWALSTSGFPYKKLFHPFPAPIPTLERYQLVEVLEDYNSENGTKVVCLFRVGKGCRSLFSRMISCGKDDLSTIISSHCMDMFSHQVPCFRATGDRTTASCLQLDPSSIPLFVVESKHFACEINDNTLCLGLNNQEKIGKQIEEEDINVIDDQEIHKNGERGRNPEVSAHGIKGIESESNGNETSCRQFTLKFYNFYDSESEENFVLGQIWALYDEYEGLPHLYARIDKFSPSDGRMEVTPLEPHPMTDIEIHWIEERLPMACGTFRMSKSTRIKDVTLFSYRIICGEGDTSKRFYKIFPRKGEVWAIFKNWDPTWTSNDLTKNLEYILVEVLSSFTEKRGVTVAALVRAEGHEAIYRRQLNGCFELIKTFARNELLRFSHCIPFCKMSIDEEGSTCGGSIQLKFSHNGI